FNRFSNENFKTFPKNIFAYWVSPKVENFFVDLQVENEFKSCTGLQTGNNKLFVRFWHEVSLYNTNIYDVSGKWIKLNYGGEKRKWYGNFDSVLNWAENGFEIKNHNSSTIRNEAFYFKEGITWTTITSRGMSARYLPKDFIFDQSGDSLFSGDVFYFLGLFNSKISDTIIPIIAPTLNIRAGNIKNYPIEYKLIDKTLIHDNLNISKNDWDSRETSWDFETNPLLGQKQNNLAAAYESWVAEVSQDFFQLHANEEELNRIFIVIYGLQDELTPEVALKDITILQDELKADHLEAIEPVFRAGEKVALPIQANVVMQQFISYLVGTL